MDFKRILANAIARRIAYVIVGLLFVALGIGEARAQSLPPQTQCPTSSIQCDRGQAHSAAVTYGNQHGDAACKMTSQHRRMKEGTLNIQLNQSGQAYFYRPRVICQIEPMGPGSGNWTDQGYNSFTMPQSLGGPCPSSTTWNQSTNRCEEDCGARSSYNLNEADGIPNGSTVCNNGCMGIMHSNGPGQGYSVGFGTPGNGLDCTVNFPDGCDAGQRATGWRNSLVVAGVCVPPLSECPAGTTRNPRTQECDTGCPVGMALNANGMCQPESDNCPAGQSRGPDGSCNNNGCPAGQARGDDGTCKPDTDGDGDPDEHGEGEPDSFSGGDNCNTPPTCSGNPILCGQSRIQWRIDCNTRRDAKIQGGSCQAMPICTGGCDGLEYAQLIQQWKIACKDDRGAVVGDGQPSWTQVTGMNTDPGQGANPGDSNPLSETDVDGSQIERTPIIGGGGSCPSIGATGTGALISNAVAVVNNPGPAWCQWISAVYAIVILTATIIALQIISKG